MIGRRERYSFAAGDTGFNFVWQSMELYLLFFYVSVLGLSPGAASLIFLAGAIVDWLADPLIGILIDRTIGRVSLRAWVVIGGPLSALALIGVFAQPYLIDGPALPYAIAAHIVMRTSYSLGNIPYGALTARISPLANDQVELTGSRLQGAAVGGLIAAAVYALLPSRAGQGDADFFGGAIILAFAAQPAFLATYFGVRERVSARTVAAGSPISQLAAFGGLMRTSSALRRLLVTFVAAGLSVTVLNKSILFLFDDLDATRFGFVIALVPPLSLLLSVPVWVILASRVGRVRALVLAAGLNLLGALALMAVAGNIGAVALVVTLAIVAGHGMSVMFWALVPDAIAEVESARSGEACAARIYALSGIARKLAQALAPQFVALGLAISSEDSVASGFAIAAVLTFAAVASYRPIERDALVNVPSRA